MDFDAIVVGAGHAGLEAARVFAARGQSVALVTLSKSRLGALSCNPAVGGVAKGHLVFEIDACGGVMGHAADANAIQSRRLNMRKGPAVRSTRVQCDKDRYTNYMSTLFPKISGISVLEAEAKRLVIKNKKVVAVELVDGAKITSHVVVVTAGTFMRGMMFFGHQKKVGGRIGDKAADFLSESISVDCGHSLERLKTGTPARLDKRTIDFSILEKQWGDPEHRRFSWQGDKASRLPQLCCYLTYTNDRTHNIIRANFDKSPLFSGEIEGVGPRYCPSIEDKIKRFPDRSRHQIFLEPEGLNSVYIYPNGMSTSLPEDIQLEYLQSIKGLASVKILKAGYAVEYDTLDPTELASSLMSKNTEGLFFAGQVNRSSGYEEAAAQGLWAGINASRYIDGLEMESPNRGRSYMETLVDDLVKKGSKEPYRLFTSRSEYRSILREDNAMERMFDFASKNNILTEEQKVYSSRLQEKINKNSKLLANKKIRVSDDRVISLKEYLKRPGVTWEDLAVDHSVQEDDIVIEKLEVEAKYSGYVKRQQKEVEELSKLQNCKIPSDFDISKVSGVSKEIQEKFNLCKPLNLLSFLGESGVTPASVLLLKRNLEKKRVDVSRETIA